MRMRYSGQSVLQFHSRTLVEPSISSSMSHCGFNPLRKAFLYLKKNTNTFSQPYPSPKSYLFQLFKHHPSSSSSPIPIHFFSTASTTISDQQSSSFTVSYLRDKCGFSHQAALKASKRLHFDSPQKPDSNLSFFRNFGFSNTQINRIITKAPSLLVCNPNKSVLPKFQFLASKGASHDDILLMVNKSPQFLRVSLDNHIVSTYELVRRLCPSDEKAIACLLSYPPLLCNSSFHRNVKLLLHEGLTASIIHHLLRTRPAILGSSDLSKTVEEVKQSGFRPSKFEFSIALLAKRTVTKSKWDAKVEAFKKWGWSGQEIFEAFKRHPQVMLHSEEKLNAVMSFWIGQLGWDRTALCLRPTLFGYSLEKRLLPRASVVKYLISKGLMKKNANISTPFCLTDKMFLQKFVTCFPENDKSQLVKLYQGQGGC